MLSPPAKSTRSSYVQLSLHTLPAASLIVNPPRQARRTWTSIEAEPSTEAVLITVLS
jgi:hypothetical protein